jgi:uncharacterized protein YndB with AHSA1/START domain
MDKILHHTILLDCEARRAFEMFTVNELLQSWLCAIADVEPRIGGKYELFWNPDDMENDSNIGCRITAYEQDKFLAFEWKGPKQYRHFMNNANPLTHVVVFFIPCEGADGSGPRTEVHLIHSGWRNTVEWEEARQWFENAWNGAFEELGAHAHGL